MKTHLSLIAAMLACGSFPVQADDMLSLYRDAVRTDATYLAAQANSASRQEIRPQALARLLPNVSGGASFNRNKNDQQLNYNNGSGWQDFPTQKYNTHNYSIGITQPLFQMESWLAWRQSGVVVEGAQAELQSAEQEVGLRTLGAYFDVLLAESNLEVTKAQRDAYLTQLDYAQKAFQSGSGTRTDIDEARSQLDLAAAQTIELQYRANYARDSLKAIVDRPITPLARLNPERMQLVRPNPDRIEDWIQRAEETNPQMVALRASVAAADFQVKKALSTHLPTADLMAQRYKNGNRDAYAGTAYKNDVTTYGVRVEVPIFSGGASYSQTKQAKADLERARQQLEAGRRAIGQQVRKEFDGVAQGVSWVRAYEQAVKSAEQALVSTQKGFRAGSRTMLDILTAEQNIATARRDLNRGRFDYVVARLRLLALVGRLNEEEVSRFNSWLDERANG